MLLIVGREQVFLNEHAGIEIVAPEAAAAQILLGQVLRLLDGGAARSEPPALGIDDQPHHAP